MAAKKPIPKKIDTLEQDLTMSQRWNSSHNQFMRENRHVVAEHERNEFERQDMKKGFAVKQNPFAIRLWR